MNNSSPRHNSRVELKKKNTLNCMRYAKQMKLLILFNHFGRLPTTMVQKNPLTEFNLMYCKYEGTV